MGFLSSRLNKKKTKKHINQRKDAIAILLTDEVHLSEKVILEIEMCHNGNAVVKYYSSKYACAYNSLLGLASAYLCSITSHLFPLAPYVAAILN